MGKCKDTPEEKCCVLVNDQISQPVKDWLNTPAKYGGTGTICEHIVEVGNRATEDALVLAHHGDSSITTEFDWGGGESGFGLNYAALSICDGTVARGTNLPDANYGEPYPRCSDSFVSGVDQLLKMANTVRASGKTDTLEEIFLTAEANEHLAVTDETDAVAGGMDFSAMSYLGSTLASTYNLGALDGHEEATGMTEPEWIPINNALYDVAAKATRLKADIEVLIQYQIEYQKKMDEALNGIESELDALASRHAACAVQQQKDKASGWTATHNTDVETGRATSKCGYSGGDECVDPDKYDCLTDEEVARMASLKEQRDINQEAAQNLGAIVASTQEPTKRTFKEQCLLLSHLDKFLEYRDDMFAEGVATKRLPYIAQMGAAETTNIPAAGDIPVPVKPPQSINENACLMAQREPWGFMNQLTQDPTYAKFFNIKPNYLSQLQPTIRLYKVSSFQGGKETETEVDFDSVYNPTLDGVLKTTKKRGFGVGIKNFTFSYEGSDPFSVKKSIKAKLSIFASSMDDLLTPRGTGASKYRYADLALKTGSPITATSQTWDSELANQLEKLNFRLKAVVGWAVPPGFKGATTTERKEIYDACYNSYVTLQLTPTIHEFEIDDQGQVVFHINYLAYVEEFFDQTSYNIFFDQGLAKTQFARKIQLDALGKSCSSSADKTLKDTKEKIAEAVDDEKRTQLSTIMKRLMDRNMLYYISLPFDALRGFNSSGPFWNFTLDSEIMPTTGTQEAKVETETKEMQDKDEDKEEKPKAGSPADLTKTKVDEINMKEFVAFFYLSDLIDITLEGIGESLKALKTSISTAKIPDNVSGDMWNKVKKQEKERLERVYANFTKFRCVLGPVEFKTESDGKFHVVNLGDIPISSAYFMDWLTDKTLKRDKLMYSLPIFLKDLLNNLVRNFFERGSLLRFEH